ncbi:uncharacterized protein STEHIDRAFT_107746 [Stereum hirsutum FP-91666 SS1]|uniref:uncharacterized protein n=1 Tax=Stereum hirsutum (strain FP-91666) TaxID=721885 RepID=UPI0004410390|nr:uncharacterized protein STEHIDRAFT_107746 [Stereum hirsutum FP-91666 SS1]EIM91123.1 hypothetical protein STEHIDRAFT_107746 [Stereum hirsutum FP-91666 SS1]
MTILKVDKSNPPASAFSEPSEPSDIKPADSPKEQITKQQEENPQVMMTKDEGSKKEGKEGQGKEANKNWDNKSQYFVDIRDVKRISAQLLFRLFSPKFVISCNGDETVLRIKSERKKSELRGFMALLWSSELDRQTNVQSDPSSGIGAMAKTTGTKTTLVPAAKLGEGSEFRVEHGTDIDNSRKKARGAWCGVLTMEGTSTYAYIWAVGSIHDVSSSSTSRASHSPEKRLRTSTVVGVTDDAYPRSTRRPTDESGIPNIWQIFSAHGFKHGLGSFGIDGSDRREWLDEWMGTDWYEAERGRKESCVNEEGSERKEWAVLCHEDEEGGLEG